MIVILGSKGSMGKRYQAIFRHLGMPYQGFDIEAKWEDVTQAVSDAKGVIIATPTEQHASQICRLAHYQTPILVEKPISKNLESVKLALDTARQAECPLRMVNQYWFMGDQDEDGDTYYNYFRHGNDGLFWDCISIIACARGPIELREDSPIWQCRLNGCDLSLASMDAAYIHNINYWLKNPSQNHADIFAHHEKVHDLEKRAT